MFNVSGMMDRYIEARKAQGNRRAEGDTISPIRVFISQPMREIDRGVNRDSPPSKYGACPNSPSEIRT